MTFRTCRFPAVLLVLLACSRPSAEQAAATPAGAPTGLTAIAATKNAVSLSWTASSGAGTRFVLERKPLGASWAPPSPPKPSPIVTMNADGTSARDDRIEARTTYVYRVRALSAAGAPSAPSNEITIGPPPVGFTQILAAPPGDSQPGFAAAFSVTLDANDDPAVAYVVEDPDANGDPADSTLSFLSWNRASHRWNAPVTIARVGAIDKGTPRSGLSLARDAVANRFGVAFNLSVDRELRVAFSEDGATWRQVAVVSGEDGAAAAASLALHDGRIYLAYQGEGDEGRRALHFESGAQTDPPSKWSSSRAPLLDGTWDVRRHGISVALDAAGRPGVAYWLNPSEGYNVTAAFWRPDEKSAIKVADSAGFQSDITDLRLAFGGTTPSVLFYVRRNDRFFDNVDQVWFTNATADGRTWSAPVPLPNDGGNSIGPPLALALDAHGRPIVTAQVDGGNGTGTRCGQPKLLRPDAGNRWSICAPETKGSPTRDAWLPSIHVVDDAVLSVFRANGEGGTIKPGLVLWRER